LKADTISKEIMQLSPQGQQEVLDFVTFLKTRYKITGSVKKTKAGKLTEEPFIGLWRDRQDLNDSSNWVRNLRQNEWAK